MDSTENQLTKVCVNLYSGDYDSLKELALKQDRDVSWIVRNIVKNHVRNQVR